MTRLAVITDVHGNAFALEAVLADIALSSPDMTVNLGDQVFGRADPALAYELQRDLGALEVLGNTEQRLKQDDVMCRWLCSRLPEGAVDRLLGLPQTLRTLDGEVFACHGSPLKPDGHLFWSWKDGPFRARSPESLRELVAPLQAGVVLCGHTHREGATMLDDTLVVNAGAVSQQVDGDPRARWTLLEKRSGRWSVQFRRVDYDWDAAARWATENAPDAEEEAGTLRTGS